jgi:hypothetical protein
MEASFMAMIAPRPVFTGEYVRPTAVAALTLARLAAAFPSRSTRWS